MSEPLDRIEAALKDVDHSIDCEWRPGMCTCGYVKICAAVEELRAIVELTTAERASANYVARERDQLRAERDLFARRLQASEECRNNLHAANVQAKQERDQLRAQVTHERERGDVNYASYERIKQKYEEATAQVAELAEALRPFAAACLNIPPWPDTQKIAGILLGDLRRATAALAKVEVPRAE